MWGKSSAQDLTSATCVDFYQNYRLLSPRTSQPNIQVSCLNVTFVMACFRHAMVSSNMKGHTSISATDVTCVVTKVHYKVHSHSDLVQCDLCDQQFACKSSKVAHQNIHLTKLYCDQCKPGTSKVYTSKNSLRLHVHGKHGEGWTAPYRAHFVWKSKYTRHVSRECTKCPKLHAKARIKRFPFSAEIKKEKVT